MEGDPDFMGGALDAMRPVTARYVGGVAQHGVTCGDGS